MKPTERFLATPEASLLRGLLLPKRGAHFHRIQCRGCHRDYSQFMHSWRFSALSWPISGTQVIDSLVPGGGVEPPRAEARRILSPLRLPVPPSRLYVQVLEIKA